MATLEERLQNLTQDINPMGAMSDMDREIDMNAMPRQQSATIMDMVGKTNGAISNREMEMFRNASPSMGTSGGGMGAISDREMEIFRDTMPSNPMQPLVEMGFGEQVDIILGNPADSDISRQAQQQIINEMGTGMDIDSFLMEVNNLAPKGAMTNIDAEGINELMRFAVKQKVDQSGNPLLKLGVETGRMNDTTLGHLSEGEAVIPAEVLEANPQAAQSLDQTMTEMGINPDSRIVDTTGQINGIASINPETGLQEFGIGSSFQKFRRKVLKPVAKIAAVVPGPWQAPAIIYNKLESGYNIASGKGGIGDLMTVMAGGTQKVGGEGGAWDRIKSGDFAKEGGGTGFFDSAGKAFKGIGSVDGKFNPLQYGKNIASTYRDDQLGGYFGLLGGGEQPLPEEIQYDPVNQGYINTKTGMPVSDEEIKALQGGSFIGGTKTPSFIKGIEDTLKGQTDPSSSSLFANNDQGGMGMMGKLGIAGLAGLIGKLAYEEAKNQKGVPLTPLTQMDQLGRYNIEAEIARRTGAEAPSRVEFGLNPEGMPALSGGSPRMAAYGGIMNLNGGGSTGFAERMEVADKLIDSLIPTRKETGAAINEDERNLLNRYSIDRAVEAVPFVPNFIENLVQSDKYKDFESATMDFITPALRHESGAAITYDEINAMKKSLIPMPGDREEVIEAKSMARKNIINKMRSMNSDTQEPNKTKVFAPQRRYDGGIMNLNMGGMPRYNYGGGVQYFNQGGTVAMAEGGDMDATINIENFPVKDGQIDGPGTEVSDDIPAMLSDGEFVMTAKAVKGAGSFNINDNNGILTLTPNGDPSRDSGTRVMYKLMEHFGKVA
jgi:hypothetical protein